MATRTFTRDEAFIGVPVAAFSFLVVFNIVLLVCGLVSTSLWWFFSCVVVNCAVAGGQIAVTRWLVEHKQRLTLVVQQEDELVSATDGA